jgi:hypothetical protein
MMIRHGEKPPDFGNGVDDQGNLDGYSLAVRGWSRAGALIAFFSKAHGSIVRPDVIYAATPVTKGASLHGRRPYETVQLLAAATNIRMDSSFGVGQEPAVAAQILTETGNVLVSWEHKALTDIGAQLVPGFSTTYPGARFDLVWIFQQVAAGGYSFTTVNQSLLDNDQP